MNKKYYIIIIIFLFVGSVFSLIDHYFLADPKSYYTEEIVSEKSDKIKPEIKLFLKKANATTSKFKSDFSNNSPESFNNQSLNEYFANELIHNDLVSAIVVSGIDKQYIFGKDNDSWLSTFDENLNDSITTWYRYDENLKVISEWQDVYGFVLPLNTIKNLKEMNLDENGVWQVFKRKSKERNDVLMNFLKVKNKQNETFIMGFVYSIDKIKKLINDKKINSEIVLGLVVKNSIVYIPFIDESQLIDSNGVHLSFEVSKLIEGWRNSEVKEPQIFSFPFLDSSYWLKIDTINDVGSIQAFAYTTPESSLEQNTKDKDKRFIYIALIGFVMAIIFAILLIKKDGSNVTPLRLDNLTKAEIVDVLKTGETQNVEFKSSLRWDYREEKVNPTLEQVILKTIAAFANAKGGYLIVGVNDSGKVLGLEKDFNSFKKQNLDYFELHIRKIINNQFGIAFSQSNLTFDFPEIEKRNICVITINAASKPQFISLKNKDGIQVEKFYIRVGNASHQISSLEEMNEYLSQRFNNS